MRRGSSASCDQSHSSNPGAPKSLKYRSYLYTLGPKVGSSYILGALGQGSM